MQSALASQSLARHLTRGAIGFGLIGAAIALTTRVGPAALLLAPFGLVALRGCPTCWCVGLVQTISAGRLRRSCTGTSCTLQRGEHQKCPTGSASVARRRPRLHYRLTLEDGADFRP
ncbi:MAG TPA: hypothetical protein VGP18_06825 [Solirubrobacteraceae bacterium]|jgi:hypothetical protein|nr:hypothetical protein [Solirubrobacteraceae bacterium]